MQSIEPTELEVLLRAPEPAIPVQFLYDETGNALYAKLCEAPEYDLARRELQLLREYLSRQRDLSQVVVDLGCGDGRKICTAIGEAKAHVSLYVGVDSSQDALERLSREFASSSVGGVAVRCAGLLEYLNDPRSTADLADASLVMFLGTTMGNLTRRERVALLTAVRRSLPERARLLVGCDMRKDTAVMVRAYSDSSGYAALSGLNALCQINGVFGTGVPLSSFEHYVHFDEDTGDVETFLRTREEVVFDGVTLSAPLRFSKGSRIRTNRSHKFSEEELHLEASEAGLQASLLWSERSYALVEYKGVGAASA